MKLSIIIPSALEWPMNVFTIRSIIEELDGRCDFEIIYVDNYCEQLQLQRRNQGLPEENDRAYEQLVAMSKRLPYLKVLQYQKKLSHWQCKNLAIDHASGEILCFIDAHCIVGRGSLIDMYTYYSEHHEELNGSIHLPLTYQIIEDRKLIYKLVSRPAESVVEYSFTGYQDKPFPVYEVPCMSTCGMMITRDIMVNKLGKWPVELGIYGGGENFTNFAMAVLGLKKWIKTGRPLCHHGDKRGYHWYFDDRLRNIAIANYIFGGFDFVCNFMNHSKGNLDQKRKIIDSVLTSESVKAHHDLIQNNKIIDIENWVTKWSGIT